MFLLGVWMMFLFMIGGTIKTKDYKMTCSQYGGNDFCEVKHRDGFRTSFMRVGK
jgi:hypothetical protein